MFSHVATRGDVFWQPMTYGLAAFIVFGLTGLVFGGVPGALALGAFMGCLVWTLGFVTWLSILRESYHEPVVQAAAPEPVVMDDLVPERFSARSEDGSRQLILDLPCSASQLHQFALGMIHQLPTTFDYWVVKQHEFTQEQFTLFRSWLVVRGFARVVDGSKLQMTVEGLELCEWVFARGVERV